MKKLLFAKIAIVILAVALLMVLSNGCVNDDPETSLLPEFSIDVIDGDTTIEATNTMLSGIVLTEFSNESKGVTSYYKGLKISDVLTAITGLSNIEDIESLLVIASDGYGEDLPALPSENFENAYFAVLISSDGEEYEFLNEDNGPIRLFDTTTGTQIKPIKVVAEVRVNRE